MYHLWSVFNQQYGSSSYWFSLLPLSGILAVLINYITIYHKPFFLEFVLDIQKGFIRRAGFIIMISPYTPHKTQLGN